MSEESNSNLQSAKSHESAPDQEPISTRKAAVAAILVLLIFAVFAVAGILRRIHAEATLAQRTDELAAPTVTAVEPS